MFQLFSQHNRLSSKTAKWLAAFVVFVFAVILPISPVVFAQQSQLNQAQDDRAKLQAELAQLEAEIAQKQEELKNQQGKSQSLTNDIAILKTQINTAKLNIQAKTVAIAKLSGEISEKSNEIESLSDKIDSEKESLAQLIRNTHSMDQATLVNLLLSEQSISEFYSDLDAYDSIKQAIKSSVDEIRGLKSETETAKQLLEKKQDQERDAKAAIEQSKAKIEKNQAEQNQLLSISKNKEKEYQAVLADRAAKVAAIKAKLFNLAGGSQAIRFDIALQYAEEAAGKTGIAPAFLLAILTQESNLGANVGKCYLSDLTSGAGYNPTTGKTFPNVIKPTRDLTPFIEITGKLGLDPLKTAVSCPIPSAGGYGSAMGAAQFIPSTWKLFIDRLQNALGHYPSPWMAEDAFMASSMYLTDLGAVGDSYSAQIKAACKYYGSGGTSCSYGKSVMNLKASIQADIDYLKQYGVSRR
jgi:peptidoglycan hydrolase CwlO-like protein